MNVKKVGDMIVNQVVAQELIQTALVPKIVVE